MVQCRAHDRFAFQRRINKLFGIIHKPLLLHLRGEFADRFVAGCGFEAGDHEGRRREPGHTDLAGLAPTRRLAHILRESVLEIKEARTDRAYLELVRHLHLLDMAGGQAHPTSRAGAIRHGYNDD